MRSMAMKTASLEIEIISMVTSTEVKEAEILSGVQPTKSVEMTMELMEMPIPYGEVETE